MKRMLLVHSKDNVAHAISDIKTREPFEYALGDELMQLTALEDVPFEFKAAVNDIPEVTTS